MQNKYLAMVFAIVIALGAVAFAQSDQQKVGKTGHLTLKREVTAGNAVLPAGDYEVRHRHSAAGHFVEFTRVTESAAVQEGLPPYDWEVVANVPCKMESVNAPGAQTYAEISKDSVAHLNSLRIRGENVIHVFPQAPDASAPQNRVEYGGGGD